MKEVGIVNLVIKSEAVTFTIWSTYLQGLQQPL